MHANGLENAVAIEPRGISHQIRMALAGERHVQLTRQSHAHGPLHLPRAERGDGGVRIRLHFLAAECSAHAHAFHNHLIARDAEHPRNHVLGFRRVLRRRMHADEAGFVYPGDRGLRFQIEMFLAADAQLALDMELARVDARHVSARDTVLSGEKAVALYGFFQREDRRQRLIIDRHTCGALPRGLDSVAEHPRDRLMVIHHFGGKQRLVVAARARVAFARHIRIGQNPGHAGHLRGGSCGNRPTRSSV